MTEIQAIECGHSSNQIILSLDLKVKIQAEITVVCMASLLSSNDHISSHFDTTHLKLSTHDYFMVLFHSMWLKYENSENTFFMTSSLCYSIA